MPVTENTPLLCSAETNSFSFFQKITRDPMLTIKKIGLAGVSAFSGYMYWPSSFNAAKSVSPSLQYLAALGGSLTNSIFNYESFINLAELPQFRTMPGKYVTAMLFSIACVAPNFLMNIYDDEKKEYANNTQMALQGCAAVLNIWVNLVGTLELIQNIFSLAKRNNIDTQKKELIARISQTIEIFSQLPIEKQTETRFNTILNPSKIIYRSLYAGISLLSLPQFVAYVLISYFGMKNLAENAWNIDKTVSTILGSMAAIGNGIPGAGFSIKGINSISKKLMSLEKPSLLAAFFVLPASFSGFTTHKAMADSLKQMGYSGPIVETLNWSSNLGAVFFFNFPQMLALANRFGQDAPVINDELNVLMKHLEDQVKNLDASNLQNFKTELPNTVSNFFNTYHAAENTDRQNFPLFSINSSPV
ncbi:hypothetical protein [Rickettsiella endosymbiont of Rhagonycha lignosa]|uniref:hypothetical protein n=1 Tax=Rickettsiella endosymbiont of Rhagonycha lignosa TaxID=3077937 RepID=UPI00313B5231